MSPLRVIGRRRAPTDMMQLSVSASIEGISCVSWKRTSLVILWQIEDPHSPCRHHQKTLFCHFPLRNLNGVAIHKQRKISNTNKDSLFRLQICFVQGIATKHDFRRSFHVQCLFFWSFIYEVAARGGVKDIGDAFVDGRHEPSTTGHCICGVCCWK